MTNLNFSQEEINLIFIYNNGVREWLIEDLKSMVSWLSDEEADLRTLTEGVIEKLSGMTDQGFADICESLVPDFTKD